MLDIQVIDSKSGGGTDTVALGATFGVDLASRAVATRQSPATPSWPTRVGLARQTASPTSPHLHTIWRRHGRCGWPQERKWAG